MHALTTHAVERRRLRRAGLVVACAVLGLGVGVGARADTPQGRHPGEPLVERRAIPTADRTTIRDHVADIARGLGIPGHAAAPVRTYHALDLRSVDETEVLDRRGRTLAVIRTDAASGALRSVVRLDWTRDADRPRVDGSTAADRARRHARLGGLAVPAGEPNVRWDDPMDAWRVDWPRRVDGHVAIGDGLTVWVHRGGQLAALHQAETATAPAPPVQIEPEKAIDIVRAWAQRSGVPDAGLTVVAAADPVWVHPNDFLLRGGADDVDARLHLAYRIGLTVTMPDGTNAPRRHLRRRGQRRPHRRCRDRVMPATRRLPTVVRHLIVMLVVVTVGACGASPPGPTAAGPSSPSATSTATLRAASSAGSIADTPAIILRSPLASGFGWELIEAGAPRRRVPLRPLSPDAELGPATADGRILMAADGQVVVATVDGGSLTPAASWPMPAGSTLVPACFDGRGRPVLADTETLALSVRTASGFEPLLAPMSTLGECAVLADGRTLVSVEGGHLAAIGGQAAIVPVIGALGRHLSAGGGLVAMIDPSNELGQVVVRQATLTADGVLGAEVGRVQGRGTERVVNAQLSPDGSWLAVSLERDGTAGIEGRLRLFRVDARSLTEVDDVPVAVGARLAVLPAR